MPFCFFSRVNYITFNRTLTIKKNHVHLRARSGNDVRRLNKLKTMGRFNDWMLVTVFLSRSIYHLLLLLSYISLPEMSLKRGTDLNFSIGLIFVMWDYVPTFCVLWKMNGRERAENRRRHRRRPSENQRIAR